MINAFILTTSIAWANPVQPIYDNPEKEAIRAVLKASYKEFKLNKVVDRIEDKYVTKDMKEYGKWPILLMKIVNEKKISYEWTF